MNYLNKYNIAVRVGPCLGLLIISFQNGDTTSDRYSHVYVKLHIVASSKYLYVCFKMDHLPLLQVHIIQHKWAPIYTTRIRAAPYQLCISDPKKITLNFSFYTVRVTETK